MTLILRQVKGSELTFAELDGNFEHCLDRANHTGSYTQVVAYAGQGRLLLAGHNASDCMSVTPEQ